MSIIIDLEYLRDDLCVTEHVAKLALERGIGYNRFHMYYTDGESIMGVNLGIQDMDGLDAKYIRSMIIDQYWVGASRHRYYDDINMTNYINISYDLLEVFEDNGTNCTIFLRQKGNTGPYDMSISMEMDLLQGSWMVVNEDNCRFYPVEEDILSDPSIEIQRGSSVPGIVIDQASGTISIPDRCTLDASGNIVVWEIDGNVISINTLSATSRRNCTSHSYRIGRSSVSGKITRERVKRPFPKYLMEAIKTDNILKRSLDPYTNEHHAGLMREIPELAPRFESEFIYVTSDNRVYLKGQDMWIPIDSDDIHRIVENMHPLMREHWDLYMSI